MAVYIFRRHDALTLWQITGGNNYKFFRYDAVFYDFLLTVYIPQEQIQRVYPLDQTFFKLLKIIMGDDPWDRIERKELLVEFTAFINPEFDAVPRHQPVDPFCVFYQFFHAVFPPDINQISARPAARGKSKEFRLRNSRAERGRFSDKYPLRASAHPAERFCLIGNEVSY